MIFKAKSTPQGKAVFQDPHEAKSYLSRKAGKDLFIDIQEDKKTRSTDFNRFERVVLQYLSIETGYTPDELHDIFKIMTWGTTVVKLNGLEIEVPPRSRDKTTTEFFKLIETIKQFCIDNQYTEVLKLFVDGPNNDQQYGYHE